MYNKKDFTYGFEVEWGDIDRTLVIPEHLGKWEYSETDIVNKRPPYENVCADPQGLVPNMGGEINTVPTKTWQEQVAKIAELRNWFIEQGCPPTSNSISHSHIHIHIPGLKDDIDALKKLTNYINANQEETITIAGGFDESINLKPYKGAKMYFKYDGGRRIPQYIVDNINNLATDFDSFIKLHAAGKDGISMGRPFRYGINMYSLKHTNTIEFRFFRNTISIHKLFDCFKFVEEFIDAALNTGKTVKEIMAEQNYDFPEFYFDENEFNGWLTTKYDKSRGKKVRQYYEI
jgi:hypothetical protein